MNVYARAIRDLGISRDHQGRDGLLFLFLSALSDLETANPTADTHANSWQELLHRLEAYRDTDGYHQVATLIGARAG